MFNKHDVLEHLRAYHIDAQDLAQWEEQFNLPIPVGSDGERQYSPHHVNIFKNIKKNLALGHSLETIQGLITAPPVMESASTPVMEAVLSQSPSSMSESRWDDWEPDNVGDVFSEGDVLVAEGVGGSHTTPTSMTSEPLPVSGDSKPLFQKALVSLNKANAYVSTPAPFAQRMDGAVLPSHSMQVMMDRLMDEKRDLHQRLIETEKLNSHLYNANNMFHRKVKALSDSIEKLREENGEHKYFKALDDKARLHKQLIQADKMIQELKKAVVTLKQDKLALQQTYQADMQGFSRQLQYLQSESMDAKTLMPTLFCGQWNESIVLHETYYDHYGIDIPPSRERTFRISEPPKVMSGVVGSLSITYAYEQNANWKRQETHFITPVGAERLKGFMVVEYWLEDTPVAKASYRVSCVRHRGMQSAVMLQ